MKILVPRVWSLPRSSCSGSPRGSGTVQAVDCQGHCLSSTIRWADPRVGGYTMYMGCRTLRNQDRSEPEVSTVAVSFPRVLRKPLRWKSPQWLYTSIELKSYKNDLFDRICSSGMIIMGVTDWFWGPLHMKKLMPWTVNLVKNLWLKCQRPRGRTNVLFCSMELV